MKEGDTIKVLFDPNNPSDASPSSPQQLKRTPMFMGALGVPLFILGAFGTLAIYHNNRQIQSEAMASTGHTS